MTQFIRAANPIWWLPDLTGQPLNDEYYAFFLDNVTHLFSQVYQDPEGMTPWPDPLQFQPAGTLPNNLYFDETVIYRIEIRHGNGPTDPLIYPIDNFVPGTTLSPSNTALLTADNMITNPQFADIYFYPEPGSSNPTITFSPVSSDNYTIDIGPGWRIDLVGAGTLTVIQHELSGQDDTADNIVGNPNYYIEISNTLWTSVKLVQRFSNNGAIFANGAVAIAFSAAATTTAQNVSVSYAPSVASTPTTIFNSLISTGNLTAYANAVNIPASTNTDLDGDAFVDIVFNLPVGSDLSFTNIQLVGQSVNLPTPIPVAPVYQELTYERTVDQQFNVYKPALFSKRIPSILTAWDFPLNPAQIFGNFGAVPVQAVGANKSYYAWDQTILFQSANSGIVVSSPASFDMTLTAAATTQMAVIQYQDTDQTRKILSDKLAVNIAATSSPVAGIKCTVSLWYTTDATLPSLLTPNFNSLVATLDANGKPSTFHGNWFEVPRPKQAENAEFVIMPSANAEYNDYNFHGWDLEGIADVNTATYFAIVIGTASMTTADALHIQSVGLMNGELATRPGQQTRDEVLRECQFYFEKSYEVSSPIPTNTSIGVIFAPAPLWRSGANDIINIKDFSGKFKSLKRTVSPPFIMTIYTPGGLADSILLSNHLVGDGDTSRNVGIGNFAPFISTESFYFLATSNNGANTITVTSDDFNEGIMRFHYTADCRLGI